MVSNVEVISRLNGELDRILAPLLTDRPFAYLDYPDHSNVGDSAIWLGAMEFFRRHHVVPSHVSKADYFDKDTFAMIDTIFLHGGGNFGEVWNDFWPSSQAFREALIEKFPHIPIVQLPQTILFKSQNSIDRVARLIGAHKNFTLLVRDQRSLDFARRHFQCISILCPDTAFALGPLPRTRKPTGDTLFLLRTDKEKKGDDRVPQLPPGSNIADWLTEPKYSRMISKAVTIGEHGWSALIGRSTNVSRRLHYYQRLAHARFMRGASLLSSYNRIVSDRLHVHIISTLIGIPHIVLDNSYGKNSGLMDAFQTDWVGNLRAETLEQAIELSRNLKFVA